MVKSFPTYQSLWDYNKQYAMCVVCGEAAVCDSMLCVKHQAEWQAITLSGNAPSFSETNNTEWFDYFIDYFTTQPCAGCDEPIRDKAHYLCEQCR